MKVRIGDAWHRIRACDWNENGFNFIMELPMPPGPARFSKGTLEFSGDIIWITRLDNESAFHEMTLNATIMKHLDRFSLSGDRIASVFSLIRTSGRQEEKQRLLSAIGVEPHRDKESPLVSQRETATGKYRYGVGMQSVEWKTVVRDTLEKASILHVVEDMVNSLGSPSGDGKKGASREQ